MARSGIQATMPRSIAVLAVAALAALATAVFSSSHLLSRLVPAAAAEPAGSLDQAHPVAVVVELFTSEGCSSCPPADDVLTKLVGTQPVPGVRIIGLGEHVDYWDRLGWRDPFSSADFSARQSDYSRVVFHLGSIYTPQMVVDGREEFIGSDYSAALSAIGRAARAVKGTLRLSLAMEPDLIARVDTDGLPGPAVVFLAVTERGLATQVRRGENGGRRLKHSAVVRSLSKIGAVAPEARPWSAARPVAVSPEWTAAHLAVVAFAQDPATRRIVAAAAAPLVP